MTDHSARMRDQFADMLEATRLTGAGRLTEATDLIQRSLSGAGATPDSIEPPTLDLTAEPVEDRAFRSAEVKDPTAQATSSTQAKSSAQAVPVPERVREALGEAVGAVRGFGRGVAPVLKGLGAGLARPAMQRQSTTAARPPEGEGAFVTRTVSGLEGARDYRLFIPARPQHPAALVVMLHGCNQTADDFAVGTDMNRHAARDGLFVAYPVQTGRANPQRCWNWFEPRHQGRDSGEAAIIAAITRAVMTDHAIDPARVFIAGLSAGGAAAANVARAYPELYAAVGVHSGLAAGCARDVGSAMMAMQMGASGPASGLRIPTIVFHGEDDPTVSIRNADQLLAQAGAAGLTAERDAFEGTGHAFTRTRYAEAGGGGVLESWRVRGAGHAWFGGTASGSYTDPRGPDASRAMLDFFAEHPRR